MLVTVVVVLYQIASDRGKSVNGLTIYGWEKLKTLNNNTAYWSSVHAVARGLSIDPRSLTVRCTEPRLGATQSNSSKLKNYLNPQESVIMHNRTNRFHHRNPFVEVRCHPNSGLGESNTQSNPSFRIIRSPLNILHKKFCKKKREHRPGNCKNNFVIQNSLTKV